MGTISRQLAGPSDTSVRSSEGGYDDPLGLKVVHRPSGQRRVDIVFIHGLGGSSRMTWSKNRDPSLFWPLKFLSHEPDISEARILTFGYNANFKSGSGKAKLSILDFAKDLLYDLKYAQDDSTPELEDLCIGEASCSPSRREHCDFVSLFTVVLGGSDMTTETYNICCPFHGWATGQRGMCAFLVSRCHLVLVVTTKLLSLQAYMQGQNDPVYQNIVNSISSIVFLSTPHRGTHLAETLNRILQVSFMTSPTQFIAELAGGSQTLQKLNEQFRHVAPRLQIVSFYETRPTPLIKKTQIVSFAFVSPRTSPSRLLTR